MSLRYATYLSAISLVPNTSLVDDSFAGSLLARHVGLVHDEPVRPTSGEQILPPARRRYGAVWKSRCRLSRAGDS